MIAESSNIMAIFFLIPFVFPRLLRLPAKHSQILSCESFTLYETLNSTHSFLKGESHETPAAEVLCSFIVSIFL